MMLFSVFANDEQGHQNISSCDKSAAHIILVANRLHQTNPVLIIMVCLIESEDLLNGMTHLAIMLH